MTYAPQTQVIGADSPSIDAFGRWRTSQPNAVFDAQLTYNLQPLTFEAVTNGSGATVTHDATNRMALMTFSSTPTGGKAFMQSYKCIRYQPGRSQQIYITFVMGSGVANVVKFAGYSDGVNGVEFQLSGTTKQFVLYSGTGNGNQTVAQSSWNLDKLDGTGLSGLTLDTTKVQILAIDLQALYSGRVRVGFIINGILYYVHQFLAANLITTPYVQSANLPIRAGMTCTGTVSATMNYICATVMSEGGQEDIAGRGFAQSMTAAVSAGSGARTHLLSIRPKTTFNSIANRIEFDLTGVTVLVTGTNPVLWELCIGQAITGASYADVNSTYSGFEFSAGTISGSPALVIASGYVAASATANVAISQQVLSNYPITLDAAGAVRANGTISLIAQGLGGASNTFAAMEWREVR